MKLTGFLFAAALLGSCTQPAAEENYTRHVDPKIGTGGHGHVFVGANVPFGLVQVGPTSIPQTWDWCSGDRHGRPRPRIRGANAPFRLGTGAGRADQHATWDWCSGYHASDSTVIGFSHTHLSGTGIGDLFDVTVMPVTGEVTYAPPDIGTVVLCRPDPRNCPAGLLFGAVDALRHPGRADGHGARGSAPLHLPGV